MESRWRCALSERVARSERFDASCKDVHSAPPSVRACVRACVCVCVCVRACVRSTRCTDASRYERVCQECCRRSGSTFSLLFAVHSCFLSASAAGARGSAAAAQCPADHTDVNTELRPGRSLIHSRSHEEPCAAAPARATTRSHSSGSRCLPRASPHNCDAR